VSSAVLRLVGPAIAEAAGTRAGELVLPDSRTGRPTGMLLEEAGLPVEWALSASHADGPARHAAASRHAIGMLHGYGVTAFQDAASSLEIMQALHALDLTGALHAWVVSSAVLNDPLFGFAPVGAELIAASRDLRGPYHRPSFVKIFLDGIPPMRTAAMLAPYLPDELHGAAFHGRTTFTTDALADLLYELAGEGLSVKIHCTGDASVRSALDAVERVRRAGLDEPRFHIAHGQLVDPADIPRFAEWDVAADISPFVWFPGVIPNAIASTVPAPLSGRIHPNRDLLSAGAPVCGGSDWPVSETPNPWVGVHGLVTRRDPHGDYADPLWPQQAIGVAEALDIFTVNGAQAMGLGELTGALRPGSSADFVVIDRNPFEVDPRELAQITVEQTWFAGRRVFARSR
jgi:predicted amidohydrolase YtcJ